MAEKELTFTCWNCTKKTTVIVTVAKPLAAQRIASSKNGSSNFLVKRFHWPETRRKFQKALSEVGRVLSREKWLTGPQEAKSKQIKLSSPIHLPFHTFETIHLPFDLPLRTNCQLHLITRMVILTRIYGDPKH